MYGVGISLIWSGILAVVKDVAFKERTLTLVGRLLKQGFKFVKLCSTFTKFSRKYSYVLNVVGHLN